MLSKVAVRKARGDGHAAGGDAGAGAPGRHGERGAGAGAGAGDTATIGVGDQDTEDAATVGEDGGGCGVGRRGGEVNACSAIPPLVIKGVCTLFRFPEGFATDLAVQAGNPRELQTIAAAKIGEPFPDARPLLKSEMLRTYEAIFDWRGGLLVAVMVSAITAIIIFAWDRDTGLSAEERKEIGILKSIGWESSDILLMKFWEGAVISLIAYLVGVMLAYVHVFFFSATLFEHPLKGWSVLFPMYRLVPALDGYRLTVRFFLMVLPYTAATLVPSWRADTRGHDFPLIRP